MVKIPQSILNYLDQGKFEKAEKKLIELRRKDFHDPVVNYLLGYVYDDTRSPKHSTRDAKRHLSTAIDSTTPIEDAFVRLVKLEQNTKHAVRIAKRGLSHFPASPPLYEAWLDRSEPDQRAQIFEEMNAKGIVTNHSLMVMVESCFGQQQFEQTLKLISQVETDNARTRSMLDLMSAFSNLELNNLSEAKSIFARLIEEDVSHNLDYSPHLGMILCGLNAGTDDEALDYFSELPIDLDLYPPLGPFRGPLWFDTTQYYVRALSGIEKISRDKKVLGKARGLRGVLLYYHGKHSDRTRNRILKDIGFAIKVFPGSKNLCETLKDIAINNGDFLGAHKLTLQYMDALSWNELDKGSEYVDFSYLESADEKIFNEIVAHVRGVLSSGESTRVIARGCFDPIINRLYAKKDYATITQLADLLGETHLRDTDALFDVAYAYGMMSKNDLAKKYYEYHAQKHPLTGAVANNLGILNEKDGDFRKAEEYLRKAVDLDPNDAVAKRNLQRVLELRRAKTEFLKEKFSVKKSLLALVGRKDVEGEIALSQKKLPAVLDMDNRAANKQFKYLLDNRYVLMAGDHRYKINPEIEAHLATLEREVEVEKDIAAIADNITADRLGQVGYNEILTLGLRKVASHDLQALLQRDVKEAALSVLTKSHKTTLVLCGSIIEALLLEKLSAKNITKYKMQNGKNRAIGRMDLNDLLYVAHTERIVDEQLCHLAHALRGFRNLIHPSVEQRKRAITVSESNARIAWEITVKLIMEL